MSHDITHCTTTDCPRRDTCRRAVAWQEIVGTNYGPVSAMNGVACQQTNYSAYWAYNPQPTDKP